MVSETSSVLSMSPSQQVTCHGAAPSLRELRERDGRWLFPRRAPLPHRGIARLERLRVIAESMAAKKTSKTKGTSRAITARKAGSPAKKGTKAKPGARDAVVLLSGG